MKTDVLLIGAYGSGNLGDDVLLKIIAERLRRVVKPQNTAMLCRDAAYLDRIAPGIARIEKTANYKIDCNWKIFGGGTQFFRFSGQNSLGGKISHALLHPRFTLRRLLKLNQQTINASRNAMIGIGFGPFENGYEPPGLSANIQSCDFLSVRDAWSYQFCRDAGSDHVELGVDLAFSSDFVNRIRRLVGESSLTAASGNSELRKFCFVLRDWTLGSAQQTYLEPSIAVAAELAREGHQIDFVIFSRDPQLDRSRLEKIGRVVAWSAEAMIVEEFISAMARYDVIVTARFHGAVFGFILNRPVVGICIDPKIDRFLESIDAGDLCWSNPFDAESLKFMIQKASSRLGGTTARDNSIPTNRLSGFTRQADETIERLLENIRATTPDGIEPKT